jgi:hypothetical protein
VNHWSKKSSIPVLAPFAIPREPFAILLSLYTVAILWNWTCAPNISRLGRYGDYDRYAYRTISRLLSRVGLNAKQVFLLHEAFYDERGRPLQPVPES